MELFYLLLEDGIVTINPYFVSSDYVVQIVHVMGYLLYQILAHFNTNVFLLGWESMQNPSSTNMRKTRFGWKKSMRAPYHDV